ncbi:MAG TPA: LpqB family beta-propeller domain-containing protein [Gemmatimonadales bacterium]|jgi:Tol biopolymer transport system component
MRKRMLLLLGVTAISVGCGGVADSDTTGPDDGTLEVLTSTTGSDLDPDGYTLSVDNGAPQPLPSNGADTVTSLSPGTHTVSLAGVASNCLLGGENPRNVEIAAASVTSLRFDIACNPPPALLVNAATTGEELDPDGYRVAVDGGNPRPLSINGSVRIGGLTPGEHDVALSEVADNCVVAGDNPVRVAVPGSGTANAEFTVSCSPVPLVPPGHDIAFGRDGEVYLLSAEGTTLANLTNNPSFDRNPAWSPDGQTIAFASNRSGSSQVYLMNADGTGQAQLTSGGGTQPDWSPDGSMIVFSANDQIFVMNPDGSEIVQLTSTTGHAEGPAWSPDGTRIAFTGGVSFSDADIFVMDADGSNVIQLTTFSGVDAVPDWSPDGTKIAFHSDRSGERHIHIMNPDGTGVTQLTFGNYSDLAPAWSPDGSRIAFSSLRTGTERLYMMSPDGTDQVPLTPGSYEATAPAWRP